MADLNALYEQYLGRAPDPSGLATWSGQDEASIIAGITGSQEYANRQASGGGAATQMQPTQQENYTGFSNSGGGPLNQLIPTQQENYTGFQPNSGNDNSGVSPATASDINALYQQYLGRNVDPSGAATWANQSQNAIIAGILSSPEYANRQASGGGVIQDINLGGPIKPNILFGDGTSQANATNINSLYQQYLGRNVDPSGAATWAFQSPEAIIAGIKGSPEYQALHGGSSSGGNAQNLANQVFNLYATNQNYDKQLNELNALAATDPKAFYEARIGLLGKQMGWQIGQNTGDRNSVYQSELNSLIPGALASGMTQDQINSLINKNTASASQQNQARIAADAASGAGKGWVNQNIPGGWGTVAAAAALVAAPYLAPELFAAAGAGEASFIAADAASMAANGLSQAAIAQNLAVGYGLSAEAAAAAAASATSAAGAIGQALPYTEAFDAWNLAQQGLGASDIAQNLVATGMNEFLAADVANLAAQGLSEAQIAQVIGASYTPAELAGTAFESLGWGTAANSLLNASQLSNLLKSGSAAAKALTGSKTSGISPSLLSSLGQLAQGQSGMGMEVPGIVRTNTNPFYNTPQVALQTPQKTEMSTLSDLLRQGKSSWQT